jgi:hypothetical protein
MAEGRNHDGEYGEFLALGWATDVAAGAECLKSQRGVVIWKPGEQEPRSTGSNGQPGRHACDGSLACREACNELCVHAEAHALLMLQGQEGGLHMLHVKVDGGARPSGGPSCWQCSWLILFDGRIDYMWLLHDGGLRRYSVAEFHRLTLERLRLPVLIEGESDG